MNKARLKKLLILNLPYVLIGLYATKLGEAWHLADGADMSGKLLHLMDGLSAAFCSPWPSFVPADLLLGITIGCLMGQARRYSAVHRSGPVEQRDPHEN